MSKVTEFFGKEQTHIRSILLAPARGGAPGPRPRYVKAMTSRKSPLELAALATAAVPGMRVTALRPPTYSDELSTVTGIEDAGGHRWIVTSPHEEVSGPALEATSGILDRLGQAHDHDYIPFDVPRLAGQVKTSDGGTVYVHRDPGGTAPSDEDLDTDPLLPSSLGRALAALHNLPETVFSSIGLPSYTAIECRDRNLALLDEAAREVAIPAALWSRWEAALEDVARARIPGLTAARLIALSLGVAIVVALAILAVTGAWPVALIVSVGVAFLPYAWVVSRLGAHAKTVRAAWPEVIDAMVSGVRAGTALPQVLCDLADEGPVPVRFAFEAFSRDYSANGRFELALDTMKETVADPVADRIVEALRIARSVGGADLTRLLQDLASLLREDARVRGELEARQSWTVGAARLGLAAPWVVLLLLSGGGASAHVWNSPGGVAVLCSGAGICVIAYLIMKAMGRLSTDPRNLGGAR